MIVLGLFVLTATVEIVGCYLPYVWLRKSGSPWLLVPGAASLVLFVWLLTLHPTASGRVYAAYGGVYVMPDSSGLAGWPVWPCRCRPRAARCLPTGCENRPRLPAWVLLSSIHATPPSAV